MDGTALYHLALSGNAGPLSSSHYCDFCTIHMWKTPV